ncbi:MAG: NADH-quinone oxidoreductase subunit NuoH [Candidatus Sumerlaeia bacterium]|nr:NADH-quinone oxidoreductase subunit NuoH [Candidatus Sumerlaeia bacterium]
MARNFTEIFGSVWFAIPAAVTVIMGFLAINALMIVWMERKVAARMQRRMGPTERGVFGLLQTTYDMIKLMSKELITPRHVSRKLYLVAPVVLFTPIIAICSLFPLSENWVFHDYDIALVLVLAFSGMAVVGIFAAGWGSNNKYSLLGAVRSILQNIAYEVPLILSVLAVVIMARTMSLHEIVMEQSTIPYIVVQPLAAIIFFIAATAETNRAPFDIPEAESELVGGFHTEYSGMRFGLFFFAEYSSMIIVCALATVLFLGGWQGPILPGFVWFFIKVYFLIFLMMWFRWTFPRLRFDQLLRFAWLLLVPLALANLLVTAIIVKLI